VTQNDLTYTGYTPALTVTKYASNVSVHTGCLDLESNYVSSNNYHTSELETKGTVSGPGVYWEARVKMPTIFNGQSFDFWTADNYTGPEIDMMEFWTPNGKNSNGWNSGNGFVPYQGTTVANPSAWHIFAVLWTSTAITYYVDGVQTMQYTNDVNQSLSFFYAVVGNSLCPKNTCGGQPSGGTGFPSHFYIDYIHVYAITGTAISPQANYGGPGDATGSTTCSGN